VRQIDDLEEILGKGTASQRSALAWSWHESVLVKNKPGQKRTKR